MLFGDFGEKFFILEVLTYFDPFLPLLERIKYIGQNKSSRAQIFAVSYF
jgi:hypothetical protein